MGIKKILLSVIFIPFISCINQNYYGCENEYIRCTYDTISKYSGENLDLAKLLIESSKVDENNYRVFVNPYLKETIILNDKDIIKPHETKDIFDNESSGWLWSSFLYTKENVLKISYKRKTLYVNFVEGFNYIILYGDTAEDKKFNINYSEIPWVNYYE